MQWLDNIKNSLFKRQQNNTAKQLATQRSPISWDKCHNVAILFNASDAANLPAVFQHIRLLISEGKNVQALGYWDANDLNSAPTQYPVFNRKNLSFSNIPQGELVQNFTQQRPDVLLALYNGKVQALDYLLTVSQANFRAGFYSGEKLDSLDFIVQPSSTDLETGIKELLSQLLRVKFNS